MPASADGPTILPHATAPANPSFHPPQVANPAMMTYMNLLAERRFGD